MAAIADIEIAGIGHTAGERRPSNAFVAEWSGTIAARLDPVSARSKRLGECNKSGLGSAKRPGLSHCAVEGDAVIGHDHISHHSSSRRAFR
jgi:hypothetical protein